MGSDSRPVCYRCAQIKQACDGSLPCARCVRLSLPCRPRDSSGTGANSQLAGEMPKARIRRVQTGCLMCKRRKKKCDETKPRCGDCRRLCLECTWPAERPKEKSLPARARAPPGPAAAPASSAQPVTTTLTPAASSPSTTPSRDRCSKDTESDVASLTSSMSSPSSASPSSPYSSPLPQPPMDIPMSTEIVVKGSQSPALSQSSTGGYSVVDYLFNHSSMNRNHIQSSSSSDSNGPIFGIFDTFLTNSSAMDPEFGAKEAPRWECEPQVSFPAPLALDPYSTPISFGSPHESVDSSTFAPSLSIYVPQVLPQLSLPEDRALLNHYRAIVSMILSRSTCLSNPYNHHLLPLAQSSDTILHCILALSASHWRRTQPQLAERGMHHQSKAAQSLAMLLPHVNRSNADIALVSCLLLCMTELFDGASEGWKMHLKGAKRLLTALLSQYGDNVAPSHYKFLLRLTKFLDSAATISTCRPPLMGEDKREAAVLDRLTAAVDEVESAVYGIPKELFHLVDVINSLAAKRTARVDGDSEKYFRTEAAKVVDRIDNWCLEHRKASRGLSFPPGMGGPIDMASTVGEDDVAHATAAYEHALRLRVHQIVEGYELDSPVVVTHVDGILDSVQKIRYGSPLESCLLFPLVMAGGACWSLEQRAIIYDRLLIMERTCGFGYIYNARDLVQRVWNIRDQSKGMGPPVNWARLRHDEMQGLVVF